MPVQLQKLPGKPVIIATFHQRIRPKDVRHMFKKTATLLQTHGGPLFRIVCFEDVKISFAEMLMLTTVASQIRPGATGDPRVYPILVGDHPLLDLFRETMAQEPFGNVNIPIFNRLETALLYVNGQLASRGAGC